MTINQTTKPPLAFHWGYIILPLVILFLSIIVTIYFYHLLPAEVAFHFKADGSPARWQNRGVIILIVILPQLFLTLLAWIVTWGTIMAIQFRGPENSWIRLESVLLLMGNMIALPQTIFFFAMLDIFSYNSYQIHLIPLWLFALIVMGLGSIILGISFARAMWQASGATQ
ncbi:DUF1648 domain-containing protein [Chloroflexota bacterium]